MTKIRMLQDENTVEGRLLMGTEPSVSASLAHDLVSLGVAEFEKEELLPADYSKMTVPELKALLKAKGLPVGGTKAELIARLNE